MKKNKSIFMDVAVNKKAAFNFFIIEKFNAGIVLTGTEIKSIRKSEVSLQNSFCFFHKNELFIKGMYIQQYSFGNIYNHSETRNRKLLLHKQELRKIKNKLINGITIIPIKVFINESNLAKIEIGIAKGKKLHDKRQAIKKKDLEREMKN